MITFTREIIFDILIVTPNIGEDKISDIITTILFMDLVEYTQKQCELWKIPTKIMKIEKLCWNHYSKTWDKIEANCQHITERQFYLFRRVLWGRNIFSHMKNYIVM